MNRIASRFGAARRRRLGAPDRQRLQPRQRHHDAGAAKERRRDTSRAFRCSGLVMMLMVQILHEPDVARFVRNWRLVTMS
jgi:hypothetical protein